MTPASPHRRSIKARRLTRLRAFLVEDEGIVLLELSLIMGELGYDVVATACDLDRGLALAREVEFDVAVLDIDLRGRNGAPIADAVAKRGLPFVFTSGYTIAALPERHAKRVFVSKPYYKDTLCNALQVALAETTRACT